MATGYDRDTLRALIGIQNALEGIERALEFFVEQVAEERAVRDEADEQECGTDD